MKDMISKIIKSNEEAENIINSAKQDKLNSDLNIAKKLEQIKLHYLEKAKKNITLAKEQEKKKQDEIYNTIYKQSQKTIEKLNSTYKANVDLWVSSIVKRVLEEV